MTAQPHSPLSQKPPRLAGLDLARFMAFFGMVLVNFKLAAGATEASAGYEWLLTLHEALEGRAAALFVLLAGIGISLSGQSGPPSTKRNTLIKRGAVLFVFGLANLLIFEADILHYYGIYFLFAAFLFPLGRNALMALAFAVIAAFPLMLLGLNYDAGWDWEALTYSGLWTPDGFLRNLFFNGFHPVIPWLGFLLIGMAIAKLDLNRATTRIRVFAAGAVFFIAAHIFSSLLIDISHIPQIVEDAELTEILTAFASTAPIPPTPLYMLSASGTALMALAMLLWIAEFKTLSWFIKPMNIAGRQALTLYIAHILIGMGVMEELGWMATAQNAMKGMSLEGVTLYSVVFTLLSVIYAVVYKRFAKTGPLETLLRKIAG